jgi:hypothetical protein
MVATYLDNLGVRWDYEPKRFDLGRRTYLPDFFLPDNGCYWETKGWFGSDAQAVVSDFRKFYPEECLVVITRPAMEMMMGKETLRHRVKAEEHE